MLVRPEPRAFESLKRGRAQHPRARGGGVAKNAPFIRVDSPMAPAHQKQDVFRSTITHRVKRES
tara:strand:- start:4916 stop:5107 length:192 start_codon:yes stop_codon:yes gene_type:complete